MCFRLRVSIDLLETPDESSTAGSEAAIHRVSYLDSVDSTIIIILDYCDTLKINIIEIVVLKANSCTNMKVNINNL